MTSVSAGHIILTPTQPVGSGRPQRESNPGPHHQESRVLPTELPPPPPLNHTPLSFFFFKEDGTYKKLCRHFFLTTLDLKKNNDKLISTYRHKTLVDVRGRHTPRHKIDHVLVYERVEKFNPSISHYRREHTPFRRYLPSDLTTKDMHRKSPFINQLLKSSTYPNLLFTKGRI